MKVVARPTRITYKFRCKGCGCRLEAESNELTALDDRTMQYHCPECKDLRTISRIKLHVNYHDNYSDEE